jgi:hypothetical protein
MGYRQTTLEKLVQNDEAARFRPKGLHEGFQHNDLTIFPKDEVSSQRELTILIRSSGKKKSVKRQLGSKSCLEA